MAEPMDHRIVAEVVRLLRRIRVDNGFRTDIGEQVIDEDNQAEIDPDKVTVEVVDDDETADYQNCSRRSASLQLSIALYLPVKTVTQSVRRDARRMFADIRQALGDPSQQQFPSGPSGVVSGLQIGGRSLFVREAGASLFKPELRVRVNFNEPHRSNP